MYRAMRRDIGVQMAQRMTDQDMILDYRMTVHRSSLASSIEVD
jgi:hypothetical protein